MAVLIDAENIPARCIHTLTAVVADHGAARIWRAYGDWSHPGLAHWRTVVATHGIRPIHHGGASTGKNSADLALAIDAMDLLHHNDIRTFVIVSSDADFTGLAIRLRESRCQVHGIGERKTRAYFAAACTTFTYLDHQTPHQPTTEPTTHSRPTQHHPTPNTGASNVIPAASNSLELPTRLVAALLDIATTAAGPDGWANQATIGNRVAQQLPALDIADYGFTKFGKFIQGTNLFDIDQRTPRKGKPPVVYLRPKIPA